MKAKQASPETVVCELCRAGYKRCVDEGIAYHSYKLSNGYDYDSYTSPCAIQTPEGMKAYRKQSLDFVMQKVRGAKDRLAILESNADRVREAKTTGGIELALKRVQSL